MSKLVIFGATPSKTKFISAAAPSDRPRRRNDIVLDDKSVTRFHAEVRPEDSTYDIVDLKSRNGVWMNGQQIKGKAALMLGVRGTVGALELALETTSRRETWSGAPRHRTAGVPWRNERIGSHQPGQHNECRRDRRRRLPGNRRCSGRVWRSSTLLLCGMTYGVIRYMFRPASREVAAQIPPPPPEPAPRAAGAAVDPTGSHRPAPGGGPRGDRQPRLRGRPARSLIARPGPRSPPGGARLETGGRGAMAVVPVPKPPVPKPRGAQRSRDSGDPTAGGRS